MNTMQRVLRNPVGEFYKNAVQQWSSSPGSANLGGLWHPECLARFCRGPRRWRRFLFSWAYGADPWPWRRRAAGAAGASASSAGAAGASAGTAGVASAGTAGAAGAASAGVASAGAGSAGGASAGNASANGAFAARRVLGCERRSDGIADPGPTCKSNCV